MGRKRRKVELDDPTRWVFNRMADVYDARPAYPEALLNSLQSLAPGQRVLDVGAGIGHLALPLAARGFDVVAVEPALAMLERLQLEATTRKVNVTLLHAKAEELPFDAACFDMALISDALHFLDAELTARELCRVLVPRGILVLITCEFSDTPFMQQVRELLDQATPRRPRSTEQAIRHVSTLARVTLTDSVQFHDEVLVDQDRLERILRSVSFVGPAMNAARFEALQKKLLGISTPRIWARTITVHSGRRWR
jgi:ubiquinone/menaquinone biosynthesis C-methylase UbiE